MTATTHQAPLCRHPAQHFTCIPLFSLIEHEGTLRGDRAGAQMSRDVYPALGRIQSLQNAMVRRANVSSLRPLGE